MNDVVIFGAGQMGVPMAYALYQLGYKVALLDAFETNIKKAGVTLCGSNIDIQKIDANQPEQVRDILTATVKPKVVVSAMPYYMNVQLAKTCINYGISYCDLGGCVEATKEINDYFNQHGVGGIVATDQGLAPGLVNIVTEELIASMNGIIPDDIDMAVGGLPLDGAKNPLHYKLTWSLDGLLNEYRDKAMALIDGEIVEVDALSNLTYVRHSNGTTLEAFTTSGGVGTSLLNLQARGVKNCMYKTLRYPGHRDLVDFLMNKCKFSDEVMGIVFDACECDSLDCVLMVVNTRKLPVSAHSEFMFVQGTMFTAMQRATAYSCATVAHLIANKTIAFDKPKAVSYNDVPTAPFNEIFDRLLSLDSRPEEQRWLRFQN